MSSTIDAVWPVVDEAARRRGLPTAARAARRVLATAVRLAVRLSLLVSVASMCFLVVGPLLGLYRTATVLSDSMRPTFAEGDAIVVTSEPLSALRVGQVIVYRAPVGGGPVETHRVVRIVRAPGRGPAVVTKGDANRAPDPWLAELRGREVWRYRLRIPALGYAIAFLREPAVHRVTVSVLPAMLCLYGLLAIWRRPGVGALRRRRGAAA